MVERTHSEESSLKIDENDVKKEAKEKLNTHLGSIQCICLVRTLASSRYLGPFILFSHGILPPDAVHQVLICVEHTSRSDGRTRIIGCNNRKYSLRSFSINLQDVDSALSWRLVGPEDSCGSISWRGNVIFGVKTIAVLLNCSQRVHN